MTIDEFDFLPLRVTRVCANGKRRYDPEGKRRLIEACLTPGASIARLALKAGVNANQLHKWIRLREQAYVASVMDDVEAAPSAFVPVVAVGDVVPVHQASEYAPVAEPAMRHEAAHARRSIPVAKLSAQLPNGVTVRLECSAGDAALVTAMIAALGAR
jgi:transposase